MKLVCPKFKVPSKNTFKTRLNEKYNILSKISKANLEVAGKVVITTDVWTHIQTSRSYLGVTAHYIKNLKLQSLCIGTLELTDRHTSENLAEFEYIAK